MPSIRPLLILLIGLSIATSAAASELDQAIQRLADTLTVKNEAKVVKVSGDKLYLNIGKGQGVLPGHSFEIVRLGDAIVVAGETLGHEEQTIATARVLRSTDKLTITTTTEQSETPRIGDQAYQQRKDIARIVVAAPTYQGAITELGNEIQDKLINALVDQGISVVERSRLEEVLREQKLSYSGLVDLGSAKQVGKLLGADAIILGSIRDASNSVATNLRLVELESGVALAGASVEVAKTPDIANALKHRPRTRHSTTPSPKDKTLTWENEDIKITVISLSRAGSNLVLKAKFSNKKDRTWKMGLNTPKEDTYLVDNQNNQIFFAESKFSSWTNLSGNANRIITIVFDGKNAMGETFEWVSRYACERCWSGHTDYFSSVIRELELQ